MERQRATRNCSYDNNIRIKKKKQVADLVEIQCLINCVLSHQPTTVLVDSGAKVYWLEDHNCKSNFEKVHVHRYCPYWMNTI